MSEEKEKMDPSRTSSGDESSTDSVSSPGTGFETGITNLEMPSEDEPGSVVLELEEVSKVYGGKEAVSDLSLSVREGELITLLGPSGCGKTTTLRMMAGLEKPDSGEVKIRGETVAGNGEFVEPEDRDVGIVFQDFALFPHMTTEENIAFGLKDWPKEERRERVEEMLELVGLKDQRDSKPDKMSGGQQQRVALARSLAPEPEIILLDEPFSNLDVRLRINMREEVRSILKKAGVTAVSVTHDQEEALSISDRIGVMSKGNLEQVGEPEKVFQQPESRFVAGFLGHASFLSGEVNDNVVETPIGEIGIYRIEGLTSEYDGAEIDILVRPDDAIAVPCGADDCHGKVIYRQYNGPSFIYRVKLDNGDVVHCMHNHVDDIELGQHVKVDMSSDHPLAWYPTEEESSEITYETQE